MKHQILGALLALALIAPFAAAHDPTVPTGPVTGHDLIINTHSCTVYEDTNDNGRADANDTVIFATPEPCGLP